MKKPCMQMVREAEWMRRQPKARSVKQAARVNRFFELSQRTTSSFARDSAISLAGATTARRQVPALCTCHACFCKCWTHRE